MAMSSQRVSLEALAENEIQEILYDGTEKAAPPMHMSETLTKLAHLIDFGKNTEDANDEPDQASPSKKQKAETSQPKPWPWDWLRSSLISSLTEMNVLSDCLAIAKEKKVMNLEQIQNEHNEPKSAFQLLSRKQALLNAADIFNKAAERIKSIQKEALAKSQRNSEFYSELFVLRQHWRIKRVGQHILGDLSFKSAGSSFWHKGTFEIFKRANDVPGMSALDVKIPPELEGSAHIQVSIHMTTSDDSVSKLDSMLTIPQKLPTGPDESARLQIKLETAQNVLFCKELFSQISREAFKLDCTIPHMVVNNQVIVHLFPDFKMHIMFCHSNTTDEDAKAVSPVADPTLQLALHQLLRDQHYKMLHKEPPHPITASIGPTKRRRVAGPNAATKAELLAMERPEQENILAKMVDIGRHVVLRLRVVEIIEHLASSMSDPLILMHTDGLSNELNTSLKVSITSPNYDQIKTSFMLQINKGKVFATGRTGTEIDLAHEAQRLEDYIVWQISQYQIQSVLSLAKMMGCKVLSVSFSSVSPHMEVFGTNPSILVSSPDGSSVLAVRGNTVAGLEVFVSQSDSQSSALTNSDLITDAQWSFIRKSFQQIDLSKMAGKNFTHKMELLMAVYSGRSKDK